MQDIYYYNALICALFLASIALLCWLASVGQCWLERCRQQEKSREDV